MHIIFGVLNEFGFTYKIYSHNPQINKLFSSLEDNFLDFAPNRISEPRSIISSLFFFDQTNLEPTNLLLILYMPQDDRLLIKYILPSWIPYLGSIPSPAAKKLQTLIEEEKDYPKQAVLKITKKSSSWRPYTYELLTKNGWKMIAEEYIPQLTNYKGFLHFPLNTDAFLDSLATGGISIYHDPPLKRISITTIPKPTNDALIKFGEKNE